MRPVLLQILGYVLLAAFGGLIGYVVAVIIYSLTQ